MHTQGEVQKWHGEFEKLIKVLELNHYISDKNLAEKLADEVYERKVEWEKNHEICNNMRRCARPHVKATTPDADVISEFFNDEIKTFIKNYLGKEEKDLPTKLTVEDMSVELLNQIINRVSQYSVEYRSKHGLNIFAMPGSALNWITDLRRHYKLRPNQ